MMTNIINRKGFDTNGKVFYDHKRKKFVIEFDYPACNAETKNITAGFSENKEFFETIANHAYEAFELIGKKFHTQGGADIAIRKNDVVLMTVKILL